MVTVMIGLRGDLKSARPPGDRREQERMGDRGKCWKYKDNGAGFIAGGRCFRSLIPRERVHLHPGTSPSDEPKVRLQAGASARCIILPGKSALQHGSGNVQVSP
jgi:hypothetical protein